MQFLLIDLAWEQFDPGARQEVLEGLVVEAVEELQQRLHDTFGTPPGRRARTTAASAVALGKTTVAGPRGAARAMMRAIAPLGTAGAAG
jgi:hypothetical protein